MPPVQRIAIGSMLWAFALAAASQQPIIYPAKGQSVQKQNTDTADCQLWAKQTTGVDPVAIAQNGGQQTAQPKQGGAIKGAAGGAALGAAIGAIAGDAGKGAAIGAVTGTAGGGLRQRRMNEAAAGQQQSNQQQIAGQMATFNRAVAACMTGRGYSIQ
jgi:hypothetical protein